MPTLCSRTWRRTAPWGYAAKAEGVVMGTELSLAGAWRPDRPWAAALTATGRPSARTSTPRRFSGAGAWEPHVVEDAGAPLGVSVETREAQPAFQGTLGFSWTWSDETETWNLAASAQYLWNGAGYPDPDLFTTHAAGVAALVGSGQIGPEDLYLRGQSYAAASLALSDIARSDEGSPCSGWETWTTARARSPRPPRTRVSRTCGLRYPTGSATERRGASTGSRAPTHTGTLRRDEGTLLLGGCRAVNARILVIEDEPDLARLAGMYLEREGMTCALVPSAEEALARLSSERFDLVILDINLPGMDGFEFLRRLRRDDRVPVMVVSAREADEDVVLGLGLGADEFIVKPCGSPGPGRPRSRPSFAGFGRGQPRGGSCAFGDFELDPETCVLTRGGLRVGLSAKEVDILVFLASSGRAAGHAQGDLREGLGPGLRGSLHRGGLHPTPPAQAGGGSRETPPP
ncbi:MAG: response regulator transcription factor [Desulfomicrobium escambiense]|nr:response regulator transcription factor [Desulfomicrobium escambiense]